MSKLLRNTLVKLFYKPYFKPITAEERYATIIASKMLRNSDNLLKIDLDNAKFSIESKREGIYYTLSYQLEEVDIMNHTYNYNIKLSPRVLSNLYKMFTNENNSRIKAVEYQYAKNKRNSLAIIASCINQR